MAMLFKKESVLINIPASEIIKKCRFSIGGTGGASDVTGYYTDDKPEKYQQFVNFFDGFRLEWFVDSEKFKEYAKDMERYVLPYKTKYVNRMDSFSHFAKLFGSHDIKIPSMFFGGSTGRYLKFDNSDEMIKKLKETLYEGVSNLIIEKRNNKFYVYPELKKDFFKKLAIQVSDIQPVVDNQNNNSNVTLDGNYLRDEFKKWLENATKDNGEHYSDKVQGNYLWAVGKASEYLNIDIYSILNFKKLLEILELFFNDQHLMDLDKNSHNYTVSNGLKLYKKFFVEFFGFDVEIKDNEEKDNLDIKDKIKECWISKDFDYVDADPLYDEFRELFGVDVIRNFTDEECLDKLFGKVGDNSLVYNLEHVSKFDYFGHVGGYRTIYVIYEKDGVWKYAKNPRAIKEISREEAVEYAVSYRNSLVSFFDSVQSLIDSGEIKTKDGYIKLQAYAKEKLGILYGRNWVWKYCHILFPNVFTTFYTNEWVNRIFRIAGIASEVSYILQCFQFADFCNELEISIVYVYHILLKLDDSDEPVIDDEEERTMLPTFTKRINKTYPLNMILYGAPGTGKTYATAQIALAILENKTDSIDDIVSNKVATNREELMKTYKSYVDNGQVVFTTFHQSYGYEDFIQGLRPDDSSEKLSFKPVDGVFKRIAEKALENPNNNYVIIIDEINRGNISKVLGELITLVEEDKRWGEVNALSITLPSGDVFVVPNNLYIVGTMNSADKSISLIDAALRRRFSFVEVSPDSSLVGDSTLKAVLDCINKKLESELESTDLLVGHAYFIGKSKNDLADIMNRSIVPLLYEYFFDNKNKVLNILKEALKDKGFGIEDKVGRRLKVVKE